MTKKDALTREEILHLSTLANLKLTEKEIEKFQKQLSAVVDYVSQLNGIDTQNIKEISQITGLKDVIREDKTQEDQVLTQEEALKNATSTKVGYFKVKAIFNE